MVIPCVRLPVAYSPTVSAEALSDSPSLKSYLLEAFDKCYQDAKKLADKETGLALDAFPAESPFTTDETLDPDYLPS